MFKKKGRPQGVAKERAHEALGVGSLLDRSQPSTSGDVGQGEQSGPAAEDDTGISATLEDLIALRKLKRATGGIDLDRLNAGEKKRKPKANRDDPTGADPSERINEDGMIEGLHGGIQHKDRVRDGAGDLDPNDPSKMTRRLVTNNNFTGQTNTIDVDKHMMAYIEEELRKRKSGGADSADALAGADLSTRALDPRDELYQIAERYRIEKKEEKEDGNLQLSATMLTAIPEVDLGIDTKLKNIEETEKAKRALFEKRRHAPKVEQEAFAAERFFRPHKPIDSEADALEKAKRVMYGRFGAPEDKDKKKQGAAGGANANGNANANRPMRREKATDDQVRGNHFCVMLICPC
ncbi:BQ5605_C004g03045 [Microbotryum silenes-dioicae]|uniref:BQ5605_C004g03045 protein n=1 Tax=Microbotryum silenes-dioicae TaxID=796604 RepID=A0A2X0PBV3_9BASI|nr:BQ5605_C004g03045 [Microbotryum silenes-dioicae]